MLQTTLLLEVPVIPEVHPYRAYKPSGVEYLGDVPEHWDVVQLGRIGTLSKCSGGTKDDESPNGIPCVRYGDLYTSHEFAIRHSRSFISEGKATEYTPIEYGDVLFTGSGETIDEIGKSAVNLVGPQLRCGGDVILFRPNVEMDARFSGYALACPQAQWQKSRMGRGITIMHIYGGSLKYLWLSLPSLAEQSAIADYLDHADSRIQRYISAKERLIELLIEQKQAIINQTVTRGLDPNVPLKPSGVKWLGEVPAHWEVVQLGRIGVFSKGSGGTKEDETSAGVPCIRYGDLYTSHRFLIRSSRAFVTEEKARAYTPIQYGDILFAGSGETIDEIGKAAVNLINPPACCGGDVILFRPSVVIDAEFSGYAADCHQSRYQKSCMGRGFTIVHIYSSQLKYLWMGLPPLSEQAAIVDYLEMVMTAIDNEVDRTHRQIELMQEYRIRLIADVVTGKLDVRGVVADEVEIPTP